MITSIQGEQEELYVQMPLAHYKRNIKK